MIRRPPILPSHDDLPRDVAVAVADPVVVRRGSPAMTTTRTRTARRRTTTRTGVLLRVRDGLSRPRGGRGGRL